MSHEELEGLAAVHGLHALEPDDEQRLAMHLLTCLRCARLVADSALVGAVLAGTLEAVAPPAALRARIMAAVAADQTESTTDSEPATSAAAAERDSGTPAPHVPSTSAGVSPDGSFRQRHPWLSNRAVVGALAAVVGIGVAVPVTLAASDRGNATSISSTLAQSLLDPQARVITLQAPAGVARAKAVVAERGVYLVANGLAVNDAKRSTYVMWIVSNQGKPSAVATFDVRSKATVELSAGKLPLRQSEISQLLVSLEPGRHAPAKPSGIDLSGAVS